MKDLFKKLLLFFLGLICDFDEQHNFKLSLGRISFWIVLILFCRNQFFLQIATDIKVIYLLIALLFYNSGNKGKEILVKLIENYKK